jgi:hypothetical protein
MAIPLLVMGALAAAAAAAQGIGGAVAAGEQSKVQSAEAAKDRFSREQMQKRQLGEQQRQYQAQQLSTAQSGLQNQLSQAASQTTALAAERAATKDDLRGNLSRAYLGK